MSKIPLDPNAVAAAMGLTVEFLDLRPIPENMPIQVAVLSPVASTLEGTITPNEPFAFESAYDVGKEFGFDSPAYKVARMLRPRYGASLNIIRSVIFPVIPTAAVAADGNLDIAIGVGGVVTKNNKRYIRANGRRIPFLVTTDMNATGIGNAIKDALDAAFEYKSVTSVVNTVTDVSANIDFTANWKGATGNEIQIVIEPSKVDDNLTFVNPVFANGAGTFDLTTALANFGGTWYNVVINATDYDADVLQAISNFNGTYETDPAGSGRCDSMVQKPFASLYGSADADRASIIAVPDTMKTDICNVKCPAPGAETFSFEIAAAYALRVAITANTNPAKAYIKNYLQDIPVPLAGEMAAGDFADPLYRDYIERHGVSGVILDSNGYLIQDVNTHYHPDNINPAASAFFRLVTLIKIWNIIYLYRMHEYTNLIGKILVADVNLVDVPDAIDVAKYDTTIQRVLIPALERKALIVDAEGAAKTVKTVISGANPDRTVTGFTVRVSGTARQAETLFSFGFNYGK